MISYFTGKPYEKLNATNEKKVGNSHGVTPVSPIVGYFHNVSPIKHSPKKFPYFNFVMQTKHKVLDGVSFEPSLHKTITDKNSTQMPVKLSDYSLKRSININKQFAVVVNKRSKIIQDNSCDFQFSTEMLLEEKRPIPISQIESLDPMSKVNVEGMIRFFNPPETMQFDNRTLQKLSAKFADSTGSIAITIWGEHVAKVENESFYSIENVTVRCYKNKNLLSVGQNATVNPIASNIVVDSTIYDDFQDDNKVVELSITQFEGIESYCKYFLCRKCGKKLGDLQGSLKCCIFCNFKQVVNPSDKQEVTIQIKIGSPHDITLTCFSNVLQEILDFKTPISERVFWDTLTENDILEKVLEVNNFRLTISQERKNDSTLFLNYCTVD